MEFNIVHPAVCLPCLEPLIQYFKFASTCELAEEKINKYCYQAETNVNGFLNFNKVVKFSCREDVKCAVANKILISETLFNHNSDFGETDIKIEEREIKDEIVVDLPNEIEDSENHNQLENGGITQNISSDLRWESEKHKEMNKRYSSARLKCSICNFEAKSNNSLETHLGVHEDASGVKMLRCCKCDFKTKNKKNLKTHSVIHKDAFEVTMYECDKCRFKTKHKKSLKSHVLVHRPNPDIKTEDDCETCGSFPKCKELLKSRGLEAFKCEFCDFETKHDNYMSAHLRIHRDGSNIILYRCDKCEFKNTNKTKLRRHSRVHRNISEVTFYESDKCSYKTKYQKNMKKCSVDHGDALDVAIYKCSDCEFKTKYRANLKSHSLIHKDASEVTMYKCDQCKYNAKWKNNLKRHSLVHKGANEVKMYRCSECEYESRYRQKFENHFLVHGKHKNAS